MVEQPQAARSRPATFLKAVVLMAALAFAAQMAVAFLGIPRALLSWLNAEEVELPESPRWVVVLGGSGMPSNATLMRTYYGARYAVGHPGVTCVVSLPASVADDAAVARSASSGSLPGRAQLYDRYARHVRGVLVRLLGVDPELDDLIQEVFVEVLSSLSRLQDPSRLKAYLTSITVHVSAV